MKIRCIELYSNWFKLNKIYEIKEDKINDEQKFIWYFDEIDKFNGLMEKKAKFELVEEEKAMFKAGDRVKLVRTDDEISSYKERIGKIGTIQQCGWIIESAVNVKWDDGCKSAVTPFKSNLELIKENNMRKEDLKNYDIVTLRNGDKLILVDKNFAELDGKNNSNYISDLEDLNDDLTCDRTYPDTKTSDIVKIERFKSLDTNIVYTREEQAEEMTVEQICKALGKNIKIVKQSKDQKEGIEMQIDDILNKIENCEEISALELKILKE